MAKYSKKKLSSTKLSIVDYDIAGNKFRAYYDANHKLIFVVDETVSARKPNVLLVMDGLDNRKWDDILESDYGVDLETIRPKKNNKYQKLDIEYSGLADYAELIRSFESGQDVMAALAKLAATRNSSVRRLAVDRLEKSEAAADKARDTIDKAQDAITDLQEKLKKAKTDLNKYKKSIGKEPTKKSASKILRAESQIDAINEKIVRAKKRLSNARKRLVAAQDDAQSAQELLNMTMADTGANANVNVLNPMGFVGGAPVTTVMPTPNVVVMVNNNAAPGVAAPQPIKEVIVPVNHPADTAETKTESENVTAQSTDSTYKVAPAQNNDADDVHVARQTVVDTEYRTAPDATDASDVEYEEKAESDETEEVKPLFDTDPNILNQDIAFKPIDFNETSDVSASKSDDTEHYDVSVTDSENEQELSNITPAPLSFTPPQSDTETTEAGAFEQIADVPEIQSVLDSMRPVDAEDTSIDSEYQIPDAEESLSDTPYAEPDVGGDVFANADAQLPETEMSGTESDTYNIGTESVGNETADNTNNDLPTDNTEPDVAFAPQSSEFRPLSPIRGSSPVQPESADGGKQSRSSLLYYLILVVLIILSIFALWQYQKKTADNLPDLSTGAAPAISGHAAVDTDVDSENSPFIGVKQNVQEEEKESVQPVVAQEPEPVSVDAPVVPAEPELAVDIFAQPEPEKPAEVVTDTNGTVTDAVVAEQAVVVEPLPDVTPVAEPEPAPQPEPEPQDSVVVTPVATEPELEPVKTTPVVDKPEYNVSQHENMFVAAPDYEGDAEFYGETDNNAATGAEQPQPNDADAATCEDGSLSDANGCCNGEIFTDMEDGTFACCQPVEGGDCFAPLL